MFQGIPRRIGRSRARTAPSTVLRIVGLFALVLALTALGRADAADTGPLDLETTRSALAAIENALKNPNLTEVELQRLRGDNDTIGLALQAAVSEMTPILAASENRLRELTPKSKEPRPAATNSAAAAAAELASEQKKHDTLDANLRAARAMLLSADDIAARIGARRRDIFARETFARSSSVFDPQLWLSVGREAPIDLRLTTVALAGWLVSVGERMTRSQLLGAVAVVGLMALLSLPVLWFARRAVYRDPAEGSPSRLRRAVAAVWTFFVHAFPPLFALWALGLMLNAFEPSDNRVRSALDAAFDGVRLAAVLNALGRGLLAPNARRWRLINIDDRSASLIFRGGMAIAAIWTVERILADSVGSLNFAVAARALGATLIALTAAGTLRQLNRPPAAGADTTSHDALAPARTMGWLLAAVVFAATAAGYIAFSNFLVNQALFLSILASVLFLVDVVVREGTNGLLRSNSALGARVLVIFGLRRNVLALIVVVGQGLVRLLIVVVAAAAVLGPWGVQSQDWLSSLRAAYFGFSIGGVTLSLSSILAAAAVFAVAAFATKLVERWLSGRLLPHSRLDASVQNSVSTIFGYVGMIVAILLAGAQVGLDFQKLAIIAGALSVGIGFGLQSIALNFVSGLILLWERGIRVGDRVAVGAEEGFVRRINARATEIETFDRATLIVPNSNLVTGIVKNWVYPDRIGQILISINVAYESDAELVRDILIGVTKAQDLVVKVPAPSVTFAEFGEYALKFSLVCFVNDLDTADRVRSEMNFDILRRLREANVRIPYPRFGPLRPGAE